MVKLFTNEEMDEKCKDYDPIPMKVSQDVLHRKEDPDRVNILNGVIKSPFRIGQPPANVNMYASQIGMMTPVSAEEYLREYNRFVGARTEQDLEQLMRENMVINELLEELELDATTFFLGEQTADVPGQRIPLITQLNIAQGVRRRNEEREREEAERAERESRRDDVVGDIESTG